MRMGFVLLALWMFAACGHDRRVAVEAGPAKPQIAVYDAPQVLDLVIRDWLAKGPDHGYPRPKVAVVLGSNLPAGYKVVVEGWTVLCVEEREPHAPPAMVRAGDVEYHFEYHSSYEVATKKNDLREIRRGEPPPPPPPTRIVDVDGPTVLQIDAVRINGGRVEVEISQNRHHNMGGSGTTYELHRTPAGWKLSDEKRVQWMN